jgi:hypothetical protein
VTTYWSNVETRNCRVKRKSLCKFSSPLPWQKSPDDTHGCRSRTPNCLTHFIIVVLRLAFKCSVSERQGYVRAQVQSETNKDSSLIGKQLNIRRRSPLAYIYRIRNLSLIRLVQAITLLTCIREILGSNLVQDTSCPEWESLWYSLVPPKEYRHSTINLDTTTFVQILSSSLSFCHWTLNILNCWQSC